MCDNIEFGVYMCLGGCQLGYGRSFRVKSTNSWECLGRDESLTNDMQPPNLFRIG